MGWQSLSSRLLRLPSILAGPILRRTEHNSVTVWVALKKEADRVTLEIFAADAPDALLFSGITESISLGENLHIAIVTAKSDTLSTELQSGKNYLYDLTIDGKKLTDPGIFSKEEGINAICYGNFPLPSFALPPENLTDLRLIHGSCRKPHGEGRDALEAVDLMIQGAIDTENDDARIANKRPHQLFLTGDQIYADDVADALLFMLTDAALVLLEWDEFCPGINKKLSELNNPGKRQKISDRDCGFTSSDAKSHLLGFGEFCTMYLFVWSDLLWASMEDLPIFEDVFPDEAKTLMATLKKKSFEQEISYLKEFFGTLKKIRKVLANVPTYMICDDHEVTDDWFINLRWCQQVIAKPLGRRVLQNSLLAYALFQAIGNSPKNFENGKGQELIQTISKWKGSDNDEDTNFEKLIANCLGLPGNDTEAVAFIADLNTSREFLHSTIPPQLPRNWHNSINWYYTIAWKNHEVIVLDTRTWRRYPLKKTSSDAEDNTGFPALLSEQGFAQQLPNSSSSQPKVTFVISAGPVLGVPLVEEALQGSFLGKVAYYFFDAEAWSLNKSTFEKLIARLAVRKKSEITKNNSIIVLSGDVHYSFTIKLQYWGKNPYKEQVLDEQKEIQRVIVQLTSSSLKNETGGLTGTRRLHQIGYRLIDAFIPYFCLLEPPKKILGWDLKDEKKLKIGKKATKQEPARQFNWEVTGDPATIDLEEETEIFTDFSIDQSNPNAIPHWRYRIDYQIARFGEEEEERREIDPIPVTIPSSPANRTEVLQQYLNMSNNHEFYSDKWASGKEIVGVNNIGEISFKEVDNNDLFVIHSLWWRLESRNKAYLQFFPLTVYELSLNLNQNDRPQIEGEDL